MYRLYSYEEELAAAINESFEEEREIEPRPASERTLSAMLDVRASEDVECPICLVGIHAGEEVSKTGCCNVVLHKDCLEKSLVVIPHCPFCRW